MGVSGSLPDLPDPTQTVTARGSHVGAEPSDGAAKVAVQSGTSESLSMPVLLRSAGPTREPQKAGAVVSRKGPCAGLFNPEGYTRTPDGVGSKHSVLGPKRTF